MIWRVADMAGPSSEPTRRGIFLRLIEAAAWVAAAPILVVLTAFGAAGLLATAIAARHALRAPR